MDQANQLKVNHNITKSDLKQKHIWKSDKKMQWFKTVYLTALVSEKEDLQT